MSRKNTSPQADSPQGDDALYQVFEHHLYYNSDPNTGRKEFVENVVKSYLEHLSRAQIAVPHALRYSVSVELEEQVRMMLLKKTYGFPSIQAWRQAMPRKQDPSKS